MKIKNKRIAFIKMKNKNLVKNKRDGVYYCNIRDTIEQKKNIYYVDKEQDAPFLLKLYIGDR